LKKVGEAGERKGDDRPYSLDVLALESELLGELLGLLGENTLGNVDRLLEDQVRGLLGNGLNVHATLGAGNEHGATGGAVHEDGKVELASNVQSLGHHHSLDGHTLGGGLLGDQVVAEHLLGDVTDNRGAVEEREREETID